MQLIPSIWDAFEKSWACERSLRLNRTQSAPEEAKVSKEPQSSCTETILILPDWNLSCPFLLTLSFE